MQFRSICAPWRLIAAIGLVAVAAATTSATFRSDQAAQGEVEERMKKDIVYLASDECEGRGVDTQGINKAADYIANQIKLAGLKPGGKNNSYFQPFTIGGGQPKIEGVNKLILTGTAGQTIELVMDKDFKVLPLSGTGKVTAPIVFVGYGLSLPPGEDAKKEGKLDLVPTALAPAAQKKGGQGKDQKGGTPPAATQMPPVTWVGYDDFKDVDVTGKIVVVLRRVPRWENQEAPFAGDKRDDYQGYDKKFANCELHKAAAVIFVNNSSEAADGDNFMAVQQAKAISIPVVQLRRNVLDMMLVSGKQTSLANLEKDIDRDLKPRSGPITGWSAELVTNVKSSVLAVKNIVGVLEGAGPLANETVVIGAHYDHLGFGGQGKKGGAAPGAKKMYPGADDNGSGSTTIMELARRYGAMKDRQGRRLVFIWFSGEERGLLGSKHYCKEPLFPLENTTSMLNMDMVGRTNDKWEISAEGFNTGKGFKEILEKVNADFGFKFVKPTQEVFRRSDQASFYDKKVPCVFFFSGFHPDYHKPGDTSDKINIPGMVKMVGLCQGIVNYMMTVQPRPEFIPLPPTKGKKGGGGDPETQMYLIPDYPAPSIEATIQRQER